MNEEATNNNEEVEQLIENGVVKEIVKEAAKDMSMETSPSIGNIAGALAKAQGSMGAVGKGKSGYGYKYSDLASVFEVARKPLSDNAIAITQGHYLIKGDKPSVVTESLVMHESGEWIKTSLEIPITVMKGLSPAQMIGVVCTYAKRYLLQAQVGLASEDTDGKTE